MRGPSAAARLAAEQSPAATAALLALDCGAGKARP